MNEPKSLIGVDSHVELPKLHHLAEYFDDCFYFSHDINRQLLLFSASVESVLGYTVEQCMTGFWGFLTGDPMNNRFLGVMSTGINGGKQATFDLEVYHSNGEIKQLKLMTVPQYNQSGEIVVVESIAYDVSSLCYDALAEPLVGPLTAQHLLNKSQDPDRIGFWGWYVQQGKLYWSNDLYTLLDSSPKTLIPSFASYSQFLLADDARCLKRHMVKLLRSYQHVQCYHRLFLPNKRVKCIEFHGSTLLDTCGKVVGLTGTVRDITDLINAQQAWQTRYQLTNLDSLEAYLLDQKSQQFVFVSEGACKNLGYSQSELIGMTPFDIFTEQSRQQMMAMMMPVFEGKETQLCVDTYHMRKNGHTYPVEINLQALVPLERKQFVILARDISQRPPTQDQHFLLRSVIDATSDLIFYKDILGRYVGCNKAFAQCLHLPEDAIIGRTDKQLQTSNRVCDFSQNDIKVLNTGQASIYKSQIIDNNSEKKVLKITKTPYYNDQGELQGVVGISHDVTVDVKIKDKLQKQRNSFAYDAHYDALTKLPNRSLFMDRLNQAINKAKRTREGIAVFFIDIDNFKLINDRLGHDVGDAVLQKVAARLTHCVRKMDTIARLGGDEFTAIIEGALQPQIAALIANKINISLCEPIDVADNQLQLSASIGIAVFPDNGDTAELLLKCADKAMYQVKQQGRDSFQFFSKSCAELAYERSLMESQLHNALQNEEFILHYQAQVSLETNQITVIEALIRWNHVQLGYTLPEKFIALAEDVGLIQKIDEWVIEQACLQIVKWKQRGLEDVKISVNLSSTELVRSNLYDIVLSILERTGCSPLWLELEVTENCFIGEIDKIHQLLHKFNQLGVSVVVDDFGTGCSSLVNLRKLPISKLKIDDSFIHNIPNSSDDVSIVQAILSIGRSLDLQVVAEGVETDEQRQFLQQQGCQSAQGFLLSVPVCAEDIEGKLSLPST